MSDTVPGGATGRAAVPPGEGGERAGPAAGATDPVRDRAGGHAQPDRMEATSRGTDGTAPSRNRARPGADTAAAGARGSARRSLWLALVSVLAVFLAVAWVSGRQSLMGGPDQPSSLDAVRLGPGPGEPVADYLAALPARLPPAGAPAVPALVQFRAEQPPADVARLLSGISATVTPASVVFRVPLPRVQTALRFQPLPPVDTPAPAAGLSRRLELAERAAWRGAWAEATRLTGRPAAVAHYEAAVLGAPNAAGCRCVLAVLVLADRGALTALAQRPLVRAVDAAPEGTALSGVALAPLLPEQTDVAGPIPDDGPVPAPTNPG